MTSSQRLKNVPLAIFRAGVWASTAFVLLLCILFARLFFAPINLDFAKDTVVAQAGDFLPGWQVSYETAEIGWDWSAVRPWLMLEDIKLIDRRNRLNASIPEARVVISLSSVFSGISLSTIDIRNAHVNVTDLGGFSDDTDDSLFDELFAAGMPTPEAFKPLTEAFSRFSNRLLDNAPALEGINFSNFSVDIARGEALSVFSATAPTFRLQRYGQKLQLAAQVDASLANTPTHVRLGGTAEPAEGTLALTLAFNELSLSSLTPAIELPEFFSVLNFPFGLDLQLDLTAGDGLRSAAFEISIGEGELRHPVQFPDGSRVDYGVISAAYDVDKDLVTFDEVELSLGGIVVQGKGLAYWQEGYQQPGVRLELNVPEVSIFDAHKYWPIRLFPDGRPRGARAWTDQNMTAGTAKNVRFELNVAPDGSTPFLNDSAFQLLFDFEGIDTTYLKEMEPIVGAGGHATLTLTAFDVFIETGFVAGMPLAGSKAHMHTIHLPSQGIGEFDVRLKGDVSKILELVAVPPVSIEDRIKIELERIGGSATIQVGLKLPLIRAAPKELVLYDIKADIQDGYLEDLLGGKGLTDANISLALDKNHLTASGQGIINDVPMDLYWRENFEAGRLDNEADTSLLVMSGMVDETGLSNLGVDVSDYVNGTIHSEATFLGRNLQFRVGYFSADASDARLMVPQLAWVKDNAVPANINGTAFFEERGVRIGPLSVKGEGIDLEANINWTGKGSAEFDAQFTVNELGRNKLLATIVGKPEGGVAAVVAAERFDLAPLLARDEPQPLATPERLAQNGPSTETPFRLTLEAQDLLLMNGSALADAKIDLNFDGVEPVALALTGMTDAGPASVVIGDGEGVMRPLTALSADAGILVRGLGLFAHMEGGTLELEAETTGWGNDLQLSGTLEVRDTVLVAKSTLGPEVSEGVISGLDEYLEDGSIDLDIVDVPFNFKSDLIDFSGIKANGPSMGMTMEGQIETREGKINVNGVVVPAYGLNSLLGKIPLVGGLFSGGDGKGLFGVAYRVKGLTENPEIDVNAMSGLAPGFLRLLFEGKKGKVADVEVTDPHVAPFAPEVSTKPELDTATEDETEQTPTAPSPEAEPAHDPA